MSRPPNSPLAMLTPMKKAVIFTVSLTHPRLCWEADGGRGVGMAGASRHTAVPAMGVTAHTRHPLPGGRCGVLRMSSAAPSRPLASEPAKMPTLARPIVAGAG